MTRTPDEIEHAALPLTTKIIHLIREEGLDLSIVMAALTTGLGVMVAHGTAQKIDADAMCDAIAEKLKRIVARNHEKMGRR